MPNLSQMRRASAESSNEQHPRAFSRVCWASVCRARWTPTTSCPASTARAAATDESTPPDMATKTRMLWECTLYYLWVKSVANEVTVLLPPALEHRPHQLVLMTFPRVLRRLKQTRFAMVHISCTSMVSPVPILFRVSRGNSNLSICAGLLLPSKLSHQVIV